jgi:hypothetical protein
VAAAGLTLAGCSLLGEDEDSVFNLKVGDCLDVSSLEGEVETAPTIECTEAHEAEVYATTDMPDGDFPGDEAVGEAAAEFCIDSFEAFVGMAYEDSTVFANWLTPTDSSWGQGDRELLCFAYEVDEAGDPIMQTATLKDANR